MDSLDSLDSFLLLNVFRFCSDSIAVLRLICSTFNELLLSEKSLLLDYFDDICNDRPNMICSNSVSRWVMGLQNCSKIKKNLYKFYQPDYDDDSLISDIIRWSCKIVSGRLYINFINIFHHCAQRDYTKLLLALTKHPLVHFKNYILEFVKFGSKFLEIRKGKCYLRLNMAIIQQILNIRIQYGEFRQVFQNCKDFCHFQDIVQILFKLEKMYSKSIDNKFTQKIVLYSIVEYNLPISFLEWMEQNYTISKTQHFFLKVLSRCNNDVAEYIINYWPAIKKISKDDEYYLAQASNRLNHTTLLNFVHKYQSLRRSVDFLECLLRNGESDSFVKSYVDFYEMGEKVLRNKTMGFNCCQDLSLIRYFADCKAKLVCDPIPRDSYHNFETFEYSLRNLGFVNISWMQFGNLKDFTKEFLHYYLYETPVVYKFMKMTTEETLTSFVYFLADCLLNYSIMDINQWRFCFDIIKTEKLDQLLFKKITETSKYEYCQTVLELYHNSIYFLHKNNIYQFDLMKDVNEKHWSKFTKLFIHQ